jgi:hypothetical protein
MGSAYRTAGKRMSTLLEPGETMLAGALCLPKGGIMRASLGQLTGQLAGGLLGGLAEGAADVHSEHKSQKKGDVVLPKAMTLALTDRRLVVFQGKKIYKSFALSEVERSSFKKKHVLGWKTAAMEIEFVDGQVWNLESPRMYYSDAVGLSEALASRTSLTGGQEA